MWWRRIRVEDILPVSYTHLDVYKRQALARPGVATVMSGARTVEDLKISISYEDASEEEKDYRCV